MMGGKENERLKEGENNESEEELNNINRRRENEKDD